MRRVAGNDLMPMTTRMLKELSQRYFSDALCASSMLRPMAAPVGQYREDAVWWSLYIRATLLRWTLSCGCNGMRVLICRLEYRNSDYFGWELEEGGRGSDAQVNRI